MEAAGVLDLPGLSFPPESRQLPRRESERALRDLIVPGVGGRRVFRILLAEACRHACEACPMASQRDLGALGEPRRLARAFVAAYRRGWCDGVYVTSGIPKSPAWSMEKLLEVVEVLRYTLGFRGYVHVKVPNGADPRQLERLMGLVDRVSFQLEPACAAAEGLENPPEEFPKSAARAPHRKLSGRTRPAASRATQVVDGMRLVRIHGASPNASSAASGGQRSLFGGPVPSEKRS